MRMEEMIEIRIALEETKIWLMGGEFAVFMHLYANFLPKRHIILWITLQFK